jgi:hypothetical protein
VLATKRIISGGRRRNCDAGFSSALAAEPVRVVNVSLSKMFHSEIILDTCEGGSWTDFVSLLLDRLTLTVPFLSLTVNISVL